MDGQVRDGGVAPCAWLRGSAKMLDAVIWRFIEGPSRLVLAGTPEKGSVSAAATCGVTGTRRGNRWQSRHGVMVHAPVWGRACAHIRGGQPCSTGSGDRGRLIELWPVVIVAAGDETRSTLAEFPWPAGIGVQSALQPSLPWLMK